jgi:hypothetical protein
MHHGKMLYFQPGAPTFKVLHLSDTHFDPYYQEGTNADCKEPLCCRLTNGPALSAQTAAGRWGDYRKCDTPRRTVDHMLQHISSTHPVSLQAVPYLNMVQSLHTVKTVISS